MNVEILKYRGLATVFRTLGDPICLQILQVLRASAQAAEPNTSRGHRPPGALSVSEVSQRTRSKTSRHLQKLRSAGLVQSKRSGHAILCWVDPRSLAPLEDFFKEEWIEDSGTTLASPSPGC